MTIDELCRFVQLIANKEQRGFIKPSEFNLLAQQAQLDLIHDRVARYKTEAENNKGSASAYVQNHSVLDDIRTVIRKTQLRYTNPDYTGGIPGYTNMVDGVFEYPKYGWGGETGKLEIFEYLHYLRLYQAKKSGTVGMGLDENDDFLPENIPPGYIDAEDLANAKNISSLDGDIELLTHDQLSKRLKSKVCPINENNMVAVMLNDGFEIYTESSADGIVELKEETTSTLEAGELVYSTTSKNIFLVYIGKPNSPRWGYTIVNDQYVYNPSSVNTTQLTLPPKTHREIAQRMLSYIGISLRDQEPMAYAEAKVKDQTVQRR